jgi:hypothetical protein
MGQLTQRGAGGGLFQPEFAQRLFHSAHARGQTAIEGRATTETIRDIFPKQSTH